MTFKQIIIPDNQIKWNQLLEGAPENKVNLLKDYAKESCLTKVAGYPGVFQQFCYYFLSYLCFWNGGTTIFRKTEQMILWRFWAQWCIQWNFKMPVNTSSGIQMLFQSRAYNQVRKHILFFVNNLQAWS